MSFQKSIGVLLLVSLAGCGRSAPQPVAVAPWTPRVAHGAESPGDRKVIELEADKSYEQADLKNVDLSSQRLEQPNEKFMAGATLNGSKLAAVNWRVGKRAFYDARLISTDLSHAEIVGDSSAFQKSQFDSSTIPGAKLTGGVSSFQMASFIDANLSHATLVGDAASFQQASFEHANLQGAVLKAQGAAFQSASFVNANLVDAIISCGGLTDFQGAQLDGAHFQRADLQSIDPRSLESCHFAPGSPPYYDAATRFPTGFDPVKAGWVNAIAASGSE